MDMGCLWPTLYRLAYMYLCVSFNSLEVLSENRSNEGLDQIPHPLSYVDISHILDNNNIVIVDYIEPLLMTQITINNNLLQEFPDFSNNTNLTKIELNDNRLTSIPYELLDVLVNLEILEVINNQLTSFPDPPGPKNTLRAIFLTNNQLLELPDFRNLGTSLTFLAMGNNNISRAPADRLAQMVVMQDLNLNTNRLFESTTSVPDARLIPSHNLLKAKFKGNGLTDFDVSMMAGLSGVILFLEDNLISRFTGNFFHHDRSTLGSNTLRLAGNPLECDCQMKWLRLAQNLSTPVFAGTSAICASPAGLAGRTLDSLAMADFDCPAENGLRQMHATADLPTYDVPKYPVTSSHLLRSVVECLQRCVDQGNCLVYGYVHGDPGVEDNCAITTVGTAVTARSAPWDDTNGVQWYLLE